MNLEGREPLVWIVNKAGHDYTAAEEYGELRALSMGSIDPFRVDRLAYDLSKLARYTRKDDFLLLSGAPILNGLSLHMWLQTHGECNTLQWHAKRRTYILNTITAEQISNLLQQAIEG